MKRRVLLLKSPLDKPRNKAISALKMLCFFATVLCVFLTCSFALFDNTAYTADNKKRIQRYG